MIHVGLDDTDMPGTPGTNQLARRLAAALPEGFGLEVALRHQLLFDQRIPYTSRNGCASLLVRPDPGRRAEELLPVFRAEMRAWYVPGSDPGLCVTEGVPDAITRFGRRAQREVVRQDEARALAKECGAYLEGFGGSEDGVIGALAGVGLLASGDDGRVVHRPEWEWPDPFAGHQPAGAVLERGVDEIRESASGRVIEDGVVDVGKHLRPGYRGGRVVLFVEPAVAAGPAQWRAVKLP
jgi:hypothetical protein